MPAAWLQSIDPFLVFLGVVLNFSQLLSSPGLLTLHHQSPPHDNNKESSQGVVAHLYIEGSYSIVPMDLY